MNAHPQTVEEAIQSHREAVLVDEASYGDDFEPISTEVAERSGEAEEAAFKAMALIPCTSPEDVQAKISYVLNGSVGVRQEIVQCLGDESYGGWDVFEGFLRSLTLPAAEVR
jgi:hypothetical protein